MAGSSYTFGFQNILGKTFWDKTRLTAPVPKISFAPPQSDDGATIVSEAGYYGTYLDLDGASRNESTLIERYRDIAQYTDCENAIDDIVTEAIVSTDTDVPVTINTDELALPKTIRAKIDDEFKNICRLLDFNHRGHDIFRRWYIDGRLYYHKLVDEKHPKMGIQELRYLDPRKTKKIRTVDQKLDVTGNVMYETKQEFYVYSDNGTTSTTSSSTRSLSQTLTPTALQISPESITCVTSGILDLDKNLVLGYLHKCVTGDARVRTPNGWKYMADVAVGDAVLYFDQSENTTKTTTVTTKWNNGPKKIVLVRTAHSSVKCTPDHPILVVNKKTGVSEYVEAGDLVSEEFLIVCESSKEAILTVDDVPYEEDVFDIEVACYEHNFIANGIVVHNCIRPVNHLRMMEDALVIQRVSRAPDRRIFYVDVSGMNKIKAESYLKDLMNRYRNKVVYDASTGEIKDTKKHMSLTEDYWMPRTNTGKGTEIATLPGLSSTGSLDDIDFFQKKLYNSLNVPVSRMEPGGGSFGFGRVAEISRDELKFAKFIDRLRKRFSELFNDLLRTQLVLKGIISPEDWDVIKYDIHYKFLNDSSMSEVRKIEDLRNKVELVGEMQSSGYIGKYMSEKKVMMDILNMTEDEMNEELAQIMQETEINIQKQAQEMQLQAKLGMLPQQ